MVRFNQRRDLWPAFLALLGPIVLGAAATIPSLATRSLGYDEAYSVAFARLHIPNLAEAIRHLDATFVFYYFLLHLWIKADDTVTFLRLSSLVAELLTIPLVYLVAASLYDRQRATIAAAIFATNPFVVYYARETRPYALALFFAVAATLFFVRSMRAPSVNTVAGYALCGVLAIWTHPFASLAIVAHLASVPFVRSTLEARHAMLASVVAIAVGVAPLLLIVARVGPSQIDWIARPSLRSWEAFAIDLTGSKMGLIVTILFGAFAVATSCTQRRRPAAMLLVWGGVPILAIALISYALHPALVARYLIWCSVPFAIVVAVGIAALPKRALVVAVASLVVVASLLVDWHRSKLDTENFRAAVALISREAGQHDVLVSTSAILALRYARDEDRHLRLPPETFPGKSWRFWLGEPSLQNHEVAPRQSVVWLVTRGTPRSLTKNGGPSGNFLERQFISRRNVLERISFGDVHVVRFSPEGERGQP